MPDFFTAIAQQFIVIPWITTLSEIRMALAIHWFRQDLRLDNHPSLNAAASEQILPIYILDPNDPMGAASRLWLHHSLNVLNTTMNGMLNVYEGDPLKILSMLIATHDVRTVHWQRLYEPWQQTRDQAIKQNLTEKGVAIHSHAGALLWEPWNIAKKDGTPFKVFTPFYRKGCLQATTPTAPTTAPNLHWVKDDMHSISINDLNLVPNKPWAQTIATHWQIGEEGAQHRWSAFLDQGIKDYKEGRNIPSKPFVSRLSPHLHFGEIAPNQLWYDIRTLGENNDIDHFCSELGWREFSHHLLHHNPKLRTQNIQSKFDHFPWQQDSDRLRAWQQGQTGIPMVDAGMRELWRTGYMHNRVRMITGSFLVKNLRLDWRLGEAWFWDCLFDADHANNAASWQWIAGCGADAAPYFRIFNPVTQGQKFDPDGTYIRTYVPELSQLPTRYLYAPWEAPAQALRDANVRLGSTYPNPIVDLKNSRAQALEAFAALKGRS